ncbi:YceI family protein [Nocardioides sp. zg-DK7169]|uniref:YceI family protein n=1 Tax=Nocardioides sp. zg-DK7169 TaxID=2736600 RepID=UPI0015580268|nr:YceI family protein [Nocardioides sp. zg-DK7169]NPC97206.1 YceI family protein [Nocardioides sp. zg-DK7169]
MSIFSRKPTAEPATDVFDAPTSAVDDLTGSYTIDPSHSRIGFSARHAMVTTVRGSFRDFAGTATINTTDPSASSVSITIKTASIDTGSPDRDGHLASADFFDAENNPEITFVSTDVSKVDDDTWAITGDLTIAGTTKSLTIAFDETGSAQDPFGNLRVGFEGATAINRKDWGLTWNAALETGGLLVSEKIKLEFDVSAIKNA